MDFKEEIAFEDFVKIDMRVGLVEECEVVEKSEKLLKSRVRFGDDVIKTVFSGIRPKYGPKDLIGKKFGFVVNLAPREMFGDVSEAMIMAVDDGEGGALLWPVSEDAAVGGVVR